jgi:uncharacterized membrane protein
MSELVVVAFKQDISRAAQVLGDLRESAEPWTANLHGAVAVYRNSDGELTVDQSYESTKGGPVIGGSLVGTLVGLVVAALALPVTAAIGGAVAFGSFAVGAIGGTVVGAHRAVAEEASWWTKDLQLSDSFIASVAETVRGGDSAIFILLRAADPTDFAAHFQPKGGTVLRFALTAEQTAKLRGRITSRAQPTA